MEVAWLKEKGLVANYEDYLGLPIAVLEDARLLAEAEALERQREEAKRKRGGRNG